MEHEMSKENSNKICCKCGKKSGFMSGPLFEIEGQFYCGDCESEVKRKIQVPISPQNDQSLKDSINNVLIVTTMKLEGMKIIKYFDFISSEYIMGTGWLTENLSAVSDVFGTSSVAYQDKMVKAKNNAFYEIKKQALLLGANAIIGADIKYVVTSVKNLIIVVVSGTPVILEDF